MRTRWLQACFLALLLAGCASTQAPREPSEDPAEGFNRAMFGFNMFVDRWLLSPAARGWDWITPRTIPVHLDQLFDNLRTPGYMLNDLFQADVKQSGVELGRFVTNTTLGLGGIFDPASHFLSLEGRREDFGQTLGVWGTPPGAYLMLPLLGPHGVRELVAMPVDLVLDPLTVVPGGNVVYQVNSRSLSLEQMSRARAAALDWYVFVRNAYRQTREALVRNGEPPKEAPSDDFYELEDDL